MQICLSVLVLLEVLKADEWYMLPESTLIVTSRFICGIVLHVFLSGELNQGMLLMKYALNHPWKFEKGGGCSIAFFSGFLQSTMVLLVEAVNYIALITNLTHLDIVMNFLALAVIADFDDFFYNALFDNQFKRVITDGDTYKKFLEVQTTTSIEARYNVIGNRLERQEVENVYGGENNLFPEYDRDNKKHSLATHIPKHIYIRFWQDRLWYNKIAIVVYKIMRIIIVSLWFYFIPFVAMIASFVIPAAMKRGLDSEASD